MTPKKQLILFSLILFDLFAIIGITINAGVMFISAGFAVIIGSIWYQIKLDRERYQEWVDEDTYARTITEDAARDLRAILSPTDSIR